MTNRRSRGEARHEKSKTLLRVTYAGNYRSTLYWYLGGCPFKLAGLPDGRAA
ncbi:MAG: hypothetical protein AAGG48_15690 [Planctomycetota bacterium]